MNLPRFTLTHQPIVTAAILLLVAYGIVSFLTMPRREDPEFIIRNCTVVTTWPGATAEDVEALLTEPIEDAVNNIDEVKRVWSTSTAGRSTIFVEADNTIKAIDNVWDKVRANVAQVSRPDGASDPLVNDSFGDTAAMVVAMYQIPPPGSDTVERPYTPRELETFADSLQDELKRIPSIARIDVYGTQEEVIYLEVDAGRWSKLDLTFDRLRDLLQARNIVAPGGSIDTELSKYNVKPSGELGAIDQINQVIVGNNDDAAPVYLKDLGIEVSRRYREPTRSSARLYTETMDSAPCIVLAFTMKSGENISDLGVLAKEAIKKAKATVLPGDIDVEIVSDQPKNVDDKIQDFVANLWQAVVIVIVVALLLVGMRIAIVMAAAIPMVILAALGVSTLFGVELEQISIAALIISLGLLVDCAIEVGDNVHRFLEMGYSRFRAATEGVQQIAFPVLIATLTTVAAFLPMLTIPPPSGEFIYSLPVVVSVTLLLSWLIAMTGTTLMAYTMMRKGHTLAPIPRLAAFMKKLVFRGKAPKESMFVTAYTTFLKGALKAKIIVCIIAALAFGWAVSLVATGKIGSQFFPPAVRNQFVVELFMPEGTPYHRTEAACAELERLIQSVSKDPESGESRFKSSVSYIGEGGPRFYLSLDPGQPAPNYAFVLVNTQTAEQAESYIADIRSQLQSDKFKLEDARVVPAKLNMGPPVKSPIGVRLYGDDIDELRAGADELKTILNETDGTWDVNDTWGEFGYQLTVNIDEDKANLAGVTNAGVAKSLNAYYSGHYLTTFREGDHEVPVYLRLPGNERQSFENIGLLSVEGERGKVPLNTLAEVKPELKPAKIERRELKRMVEVRSKVEDGLLPNTVLAAAMPAIDELGKKLPPGSYIEIGGEQEKTSESQKNMRFALSISMLLIVFLLVIQYNSIVKPMIILLTVPMAAIGAFAGLYITGLPMGFMAQLGLLSLAGVVLNDAIVLVEFVEEEVHHKLHKGIGLAKIGERSFAGLNLETFRECVITGSRLRMLPISLTTLTTVGGLIPLALFGGPMWQPMAVVIIFGLLIATVLTLVVLPSIFSVFVEIFRMKVASSSPEDEEETEAQPA